VKLLQVVVARVLKALRLKLILNGVVVGNRPALISGSASATDDVERPNP